MVPFLRTKTSSAVFVVCATVVVGLCTLAGSLEVTQILLQRERLQWQRRTDAEAIHVAEQLQMGVSEQVGALRRLAVWWQLQGRPLDIADWQTDVRLFFESGSGLQSVTWVDRAGRKSWSAGADRLPEPQSMESVAPELRALIATMSHKDTLGLSHVFDRRGGRPGIYACIPVIQKGALSAYVAGLYDATELLQSVLRRRIPGDYAVSVVADGHELGVFNQRPGMWSSIEQTASVKLSKATWLVRVRATPDDLQNLRRMMLTFGLAITLLLAISTLSWGIAYRRTIALKQEVRERKAAEEQIKILNRDLQRRLVDFQALLDVTPIGIAVSYDPECRNIWVNPALAAMMGVPPGQNISKSGPEAGRLQFEVLRDGVALAPDELPMQVAGRTGAEVAGEELDIVRADGRRIHTLAYTAPLFDENRQVRGVLHASVDITHRKRTEQERNQLEQKLLRVEKFKSLALMAGGLAHDLNNLLTTVIGNESLALEELPRDHYARELILRSLAASQRAADLMQQLTRYTGRTFYTAKPVDISHVIEDQREALRAVVPPEINLSFDLSQNLPLVGAGLVEIQQVLHNLVSNAVDAIGESAGHISVATARCQLSAEMIGGLYSEQELSPGLYVELVVSDSGCGMQPETVEKAFDPFFTTKFFGRGLGLSEVQGVVRAHRGAVRVESPAVGGSKLILLFPALTESAAMAGSGR